jgi:hypothetical protein
MLQPGPLHLARTHVGPNEISHAVKQEARIVVLARGMIPVLEGLDDLGPCHLARALHDGFLVVL